MIEVKDIWYTLKEKQPENEQEVLIADTNGEVTTARYYANDGIFMNDCDQEWELDEVAFWMAMPEHPDAE